MLYAERPIGTLAYLNGVWAHPREFTWSLVCTVSYMERYFCREGEYLHLDKEDTSFHSYARNSLVQRMQGEFLIQLDGDHAWRPAEPAKLVWLAQKYDLPVVSGLYHYVTPPHAPKLYLFNEEEGQPPYSLLAEWPREVDYFQIGASGGGMLYVRDWVFARIQEETKEKPFDLRPGLSEDISFFQRCKELDIPVYAAPQVLSMHLKTQEVGPDDYRPDLVNIGPRQAAQGQTRIVEV